MRTDHNPIKLVSIVIINKNDRDIEATLKSLTSMKTKYEFETIVVDASQGNLSDIYKQFKQVKVIDFAPIPGRKISIPEQRNAGVDASKGVAIVFIDANCIPATGWLDNLLEPMSKEGEFVTVGRVLAHNGDNIYGQAFNKSLAKKYIHETGTANLAFFKSVYDKIGGFDSRFNYGSDVDFSWRINDAGYKIRSVPDADMSHDFGGGKEVIDRDFRYGVARARLYKKHPKRLPGLLTDESMVLYYAGFLVGLPITIFFLPYPLILLIPIISNINKHPLRTLQNHLVYACGFLRELVNF